MSENADHSALAELHSLWMSENSILNEKLMQFLSVMAMMAVAYLTLAEQQWPRAGVCWGSVALSLLWMASMLRTQAYRRHWRAEIEKRATGASGDAFWPDESVWPWYSRCPSWLPVTAAPSAAIVVWLTLLTKG
ncbi:MAG: hypothetical protein AMXMBFR57_07110 [Acidimicrobiia bacterium]